ncbi:MAG: rRNA pseudouridine synthase [Gemmatimonadetes bacterium]|nr:rRNA pseudouridine synthase [Gemmatimonadota bacterium]
MQKFLSQAGIASRRRAEDLIREHRVRLNGMVVAELGTRVDPARDVVEVDGRRVQAAGPVWVALHKPRGYVSTRRDPQGRPTIYDLLPAELRGLFYVGRLDFHSEGLILLTNQGEAAHRLLHPRYGVERVYDVEVAGEVAESARRRLVEGVELEDGPARAHAVARLRHQRAGRERLRVTMREGRKREVRRLFRAVGHSVRRLVRRRYGPIALGRLPPGEWRPLSVREIAAIRASVLKVESQK